MLGRLTALTTALLLALGAAPAAGAEAAGETPTALDLAAPQRFADAETPVRLTLTDGNGTALADQVVTLERRRNGEWGTVGAALETDDEGEATADLTLARDASDNVVRATYDGDETYDGARTGPVQLRMKRRDGVVTLRGPDRVVDEQRVTLTVRWRARNDTPVPSRVSVFRRLGGGWKRVARPRLGPDGTATVTSRPRKDSRWQARAQRLDWVTGDRSGVHKVNNVPPGDPVRLPARAPRPRVNLPDQRRAVGNGAHAVVTRIPNAVWRQMTGRSWHRGCPVGRSSLRLMRINYWAYDGYRHRGEIVAHADAMPNMRGALTAMYQQKLPIRSMYRVDRFGWSRRLQGADDYRSMAAGNTSAFNCRSVVGRPGVRSPHSYGRALDVNTWENPYRSSHGWTPNGWWPSRSHPRVAWRSRRHPVVRVMLNHGFRWTYGVQDSQHFDAPAGSGRVMMPSARVCDTDVCH
ncbi:M15 family metallopeptidase [Nocardioides sp. GXQ0305]|uniref:M15 family metallopeptidase n=1 Tax=Nocardioides sp. GXQ0305 TaxID=3423912 RepID=UPI003D7C8217